MLLSHTICDKKNVLFRALNQAVPLESCSPLSVDGLFKESPQLKNQFFSQAGGIKVLYQIFSGMGSTTIATFLQEIQGNLQVIARFRDTYAKNSPQYGVMNTLYENIRKHSMQAQEFIQKTLGNNTSVICSHLFLKALENQQSFAYLLEQFHGWVHPLNLAIADAGFMMHSLKNINNYKRIVIFSGNNHAVVINQFFLHNQALKKELNVNLGFQKGLLQTTKVAGYGGSRFNEQELKSLFTQTYASKESLVINDRLCSYCKTPEGRDKNLLRCGQCKAALYCNGTCQKNHWKEHKAICVPQKIEKTEKTILTPVETQEVKNNEPEKPKVITQPQNSVLSWIAEHPLELIIGSGIVFGFGYWLFKTIEK